MKQLGFLFDISKCVGCKTCQFACKNENGLVEYTRRRVIKFKADTNTFSSLSIACNHCETPACMRVCPNYCFTKRRNGIVVYDKTNCDSCKLCVTACPFGAIKVNPITNQIDKCDMCEDRLRKDLPPVCVSSCITGAIKIIDINSPKNKDLPRFIPGFEMKRITNPSIRFKVHSDKSARFWIKSKLKEPL